MGSTIREVARAAGVSPATVSRYFHGTNVVSDDAARRIEEAVKELDYVPVHKHIDPGVIAVLIPDLKLAYFSEVLKEILEAAPRYRYRLVFIPTSPDDESYKLFFREFNITGVIYLEENMNSSMMNYIAAKNIKMVMFGGISSDVRCKMIHINDLSAAYEGAKYLLELRHEKILILSDYPKSISSGFQRITGCKRAYEEFGVPFEEALAKYGDLTYENGYWLTRQALQKGLSFSAVFAFSDEAAMGAISALYENGLYVPEHISVLGFDGISMSEHIAPKLCTIAQPIKKMVELTLNTFLDLEKDENVEITIPYKIFKRGTCRENGKKTEEGK